jgi:ribonuclease P protein component
MIPLLAKPGYDYVFIARGGAPTRPWARLLDDVKTALISLAADSDSPSRAHVRAPSPTV